MYKNFSLSQNMQIPCDNFNASNSVSINLDYEIKNLADNYEIHKIQEVKDFIKNNIELIQYINIITPLINDYFPNYKKCLTFCQDPEFDELDDITIYINSFKSEFENDWKKLDKLENEFFYISHFSRQTKGLISVDLWFK